MIINTVVKIMKIKRRIKYWRMFTTRGRAATQCHQD